MGGACVEYLDAAGAALPSWNTMGGAPVVCNFLKFGGTGGTTHATDSSHLYVWTHDMWMGGNTMTTSYDWPGIDFSRYGTYGVTFTPTNASGAVALGTATTQITSWYQPYESTDYMGGLRRFSKNDCVRPFSVAPVGTGSRFGTAVVSSTSMVTLTGAQALVAGSVIAIAALTF
jgi:hypothetical protein